MATRQLREDVMNLKFHAANRLALLLAAGALAGVFAGISAADAKDPKRRADDARTSYNYGPGGPNVSYQQGPRTRVYITKRSFLDGGTEVLPGDRKFSDYAFPPEMGYPSFARQNGNRTIDRQPLNPPSDMGGYPARIPLPY
jgi:hypothetical protein